MDTLEERDVDRYKTERLRGRSPVTVNVELRSLRTAFNLAVRWKMLERNPFKGVQLVRIPEMPPMYFTKDEFRILLANVSHSEFKEVVLFTVMTGLHRAELTNLRWENVDFDRRLIHIHSTYSFKSKWGKKRVIPMSDAVFDLLRLRHTTRRSEYVFTFWDRKISDTYLTHRFTDLVRAAVQVKTINTSQDVKFTLILFGGAWYIYDIEIYFR